MTSGFALFDTRRSQDSYSSDTNSPISFRKNSLTNFKTSLMIFNGKKKESRGWSPTDSSNTHQDDSTLFSKSNTIPISWIDKSQPSPSSKSLSASLGSTSPLFLPRYHTEFESICKIGKGGFGDVFKVRNALDGCLYAIKRIKLGNDKAKNARFLREVSALSRLSHVNIVRYYQAWIEAGSDNESDDDEFDESDEEYDHRKRLDHREDESYDRFANSEDEDNSYMNAPFDIDLGTAQNSPKEDLLSCDICKKVYKDWEVPTQDWFLLDARTQNFNLCRDCYNEEIRKSGIRSSPGTISSMPMTQYLYIQMEYCDRTLRAGLDDKSIWQSKDEKFIWSLFRQIVEATKYIHLNNCIHRDLKPSNIFLTSEGNVKLGDFGLATGEVIVKEASASMKRRAPNSHPLKTNSFLLLPKTSPKGKERTTDIGTMLYRAPELEESEEYDEKVDVFSLGIILFELWHPFYTGMERVEVLETLRHKHQLPSGFTSLHPVQSELILNLTQRNPAMRHSASSLLEAIPVSKEKQEMTKIISENQELKSQVSELQNLLKELQLQVKSLTDEREQQKEEIFKLRSLASNSMDVKPV